MTTVYITYPATTSTRFERDYYSKEHLPLVKRHWEKYGLRDLEVLYPEDDDSTVLAVCICTFTDDAAVSASFASPEAAKVMADIRNFTDTTPLQSRAVPLS